MPAARTWSSAAALVLLVFAAYFPVIGNGFIWDDDAYVTDNPALRSADGLTQIWTDPTAVPLPQYYPMTFTTFWFEYQMWAGRPVGYHVDNVLLQAFNAVLLWLGLRRLNVPGAWFAGALFAVHPVGVESVAWITERKNVLSTAFYLAAFLTYPLDVSYQATSAKPRRAESGRGLRRVRYIAAFSLFLLALLSKTVTASLPAAICLILYWKTGRVRRGDVLRLVPFFVAGIVMGSITSDWERTHVGAIGPEWSSLTFIDRVLIAGRAVWFYTGKLLWPRPISFIYPRWLIDRTILTQWIFPLGVAVVIGLLFAVRHRIGRGPLAALLYFVGTLFPALGLADVYPMRYSFIADHFQYLAMIGLIVLAAAATEWRPPLAGSQTEARRPANAQSAVAVRRTIQFAILTAGAVATAYRCTAYRDASTLWLDTAEKNPRSWMVHSNLGNIAEHGGHIDEAVTQYLLAADLGSNVPDPQVDAARALGAKGKFNEAESACRRALSIDPGWAPAYQTLSKLLQRRGEPAAAAAAEFDARGYIALRQQKPNEAKAAFDSALQADPADAGAFRGLRLAMLEK